MQVTYIILLILISVFHILYKGDLSFILLVTLLVLPAVTFILLIIQAKALKISISCDTGSTERGKPEIIRIHLENKSFIPTSACKFTFRYRSCYPSDKPSYEKCYAIVSVSQRSRAVLNVSIVPAHCGYIDISAGRVLIYDIIGLGFIFRKINFSKRIAVLPVPSPFEPDMEMNTSGSAESDTFSQTSPGDDPSEIFDLREYRVGDSMNRIHWKLSSRGDDLIVKEFSEPIRSRILIICNNGPCKDPSDADKVYDLTMTVSSFLTKSRSAHTIASVLADGTLFEAEISGTESFLKAFTGLCSGAADHGKQVTDDEIIPLTAELIQKGFSDIIAVSANDDRIFISELLRICGETKLTVICASAGDPADKGEKTELPAVDIIYSEAADLDENFRKAYSTARSINDPYQS